MKRKRRKIKNRFRIGIVTLVLLAVVASGGASLLALTGFFGGSGSESADLTRGLVGHWDMEEATGSLVNDRSGNSNTGMFQDGTSGNPVSYWTFDEGSGTTAGDSIGSNNGTVSGASWTEGGRVGRALEFDGASGDVTVSDDSSIQNVFSGGGTVSTWIKADSDGQNDLGEIINKDLGAGDGWFLRAKNESAGAINLEFSHRFSTQRGQWDTSNRPITLGEWVHVALRYDKSSTGNDPLFYVNGETVAVTEVLAPIGNPGDDTGDDFTIGNQTNGGSRTFDGLIDDPRIYDYALTATDISRIYNQTANEHWVPGPVETTNGSGGGTALQFDGVDDLVVVEDDSVFTPTSTGFTVGGWINLDSIQDNGSQRRTTIAAKAAEPGNNTSWEWILGITNTTSNPSNDFWRFATITSTGSALSQAEGSTQVQTERWYHVVGVMYSDGSTELFVDGKSIATGGAASLPSNTTSPVSIGFQRGNATDWHTNGSIDDPRIYNRALSADEIRRLYNSRGPVAHYTFDEGSGRYAFDSSRKSEDITTDLEAYWSMNDANVDAEGETITDASGNGNTGTLYGDNGVGDNGTGMTCTATGKSDQGCDFDLVDDYISVAAASSINDIFDSGGAIALWVKADSDGEASNGRIFDKTVYSLRTTSESGGKTKLSFRYTWTGDNPIWDTGNTVLTNGTWHHIAIVYDNSSGGDDPAIYVDGASVPIVETTAPTGSAGTDSSGLILGNNSATTATFDGTLDEMYIFSRSLTANQVKYLSSLGNNDGTLGDATCQPGSGTCPSWTTGKYGSALSFDGTDDFVRVDDNDNLDITGEITLSAWVKLSDITGVHRILSKWTTPNAYLLSFNDVSTNKFRFAAYISGTGGVSVDSTTTGTAGNWYHIVGIFDGSKLKIYVNGVFEASTSASGSINTSTNPLVIGAEANTTHSYPFNGLIDDVKIYNYARTPDQIRLDYNRGLSAHFGGTPDLELGLVGNWKFDEMSGDIASDSSGNGNTGTLTNNPTWTQGAPSQGLSGGGGALEFNDGAGNYVQANTNGASTSAGSVSLWVKYSRIEAAAQYLFSVAGDEFSLLTSSNGLNLRVYHDGAQRISVAHGFSAGEWHHVVATYATGGTCYLYFDGLQKGSGACSAFDITNTYIRIGGSAGYTTDGTIDDPRIYNRALSAEEVRYLYNNNGPVGHWKFDEGSGTTAYDSSVNGNDGSFTCDGTCSNDHQWVSGKYAGGVELDGTDDYVSMGSASEIAGAFSAITYQAWFNSTVLDTNNRWIVANMSSAGGYRMELDNGEVAALLRETNANLSPVLSGGSGLADGAWHHAAVAFDDSTDVLELYIDGTKVDSDTWTGTIASGLDVRVGDAPNFAGNFSGKIDDVKIYNYARSPEQVREDYNAGLAAKFGGTVDLQRGLVGHWKLDESSGGLAFDASGNSNTGMFQDGTSGNPVSYWTFDEGSGTTAGDSIGSNNGTLGGDGAGSDVPSWSNGTIGGALEFDGSNDYVQASDNSTMQNIFSGGGSVSVWINPKTDGEGNIGQIVNKNQSGLDGWFLAVQSDDGSNMEVELWRNFSNNTGAWNPSSLPVPRDAWTHVAVTYDSDSTANDPTIYINGQSVAITERNTPDGTATDDSNNDLFIGNRSGADRSFEGKIDNVRIYDYALSGGDVKRIFQQTERFKRTQGVVRDTSYHGLSGGGGALDFDGVDDYVGITDNSVLDFGTSDFSLSFWVQRADTANEYVVASKGTSGADSFYITIRPSGHADAHEVDMKIEEAGAAAAPTVQSVTQLNDTNWHHVVVTADRDGDATIYIDGVETNSSSISSASGDISNSDDFELGRSRDQSIFANGKLDDFRFYNRALTAEEIRYLYNNNGPVGHWAFDENSGTTAYDSAGSNDGTLEASMTDSDWVSGKFGNALDLDGTDDYITVTTDPLGTNYDDFTMSAWVKTISGSKQVILQRSNTGNNVSCLGLWMNSDGTTNADYYAPGGGGLNGSVIVNDGAWHHVVLVQDGSRRTLYVDGSQDASEDPSESYSGSAPNNFFIGVDKRNTIETRNFNGRIDDVRVFNYALTAQQIQEQYNAGKSIYFR